MVTIKAKNGIVLECDESTARSLVAQGHERIDTPETQVEEPATVPDESWTVAALREHADAEGIDLGDATKKAEILARLTA